MKQPTPREREEETGAGRRPWASLESRQAAPIAAPEGAEAPPGEGEVDRRTFLGLMGASMALAGASAGCDVIRKPAETILPFAHRPEDLIPGRPNFFATAARVGGSVMGLVVESQEGRPTKVEGNPRHPMSRGGTNAWAQAEVLGLYDPDRSRTPLEGGKPTTLDAARSALGDLVAAARADGGARLALLTAHRPSPTWRRLLAELRGELPALRVHVHDAWVSRHRQAGWDMVAPPGEPRMVSLPDLARADVILSVDCDFLGVEGDAVRHARDFADGRRLQGGRDMNRLYVVEPGFSVTGASADNRLRLSANSARAFMEALVRELLGRGAGVPPGGRPVDRALRDDARARASETIERWAREVARDLAAHQGRCVVVVGDRQPPVVHALGHFANAALGALGRTVQHAREGLPDGAGGLEELAAAIAAGEVDGLILSGTNPVFDAPADLDVRGLLASVTTTVHHGMHVDETAADCSWHVPASHFLECWGDWEAVDGTTSVQQPLIAPLGASWSDVELLAALLGTAKSGHDLVRATHGDALGADPEKAWRRWLHDGVADVAPDRITPGAALRWHQLHAALAEPAPADSGLEIDFVLDPSVADGSLANNAWMQELPDPVTKLTWGNAALVSTRTGRHLGIGVQREGVQVNDVIKGQLHADVVRLELDGRAVELPALILPGIADDVVVAPLGYGRTAGRVATGVGSSAEALRTTRAPTFASGLRVTRTGRREKLAVTQDHWTLVEPVTGRLRDNLVRVGTLAEYRKDPRFVRELDVMEEEHVKSPWEEPHPDTGQQWGMAIDLNACIGCSACTVACQAENNIPVVGKERVLQGREMHWIRLDRYFVGDPDEPEALVQPIPCMQCENAPCEQVCPVAATTHSPEGLNDMAYNRCIGTRYCSNNCPYKVRRFNYFNFAKENHAASAPNGAAVALGDHLKMQSNPDVSVRFRGVIEKCTYCVQRIQSAKIDAKVRGDGRVADGDVTPACAQACPTQAIVFGDVSDPQSRVSKAKRQPRDYGMLTELNTKPRTTFLARIRNPNPALTEA